MLREYKNEKIYKNLKKIRTLSIISLIISFIGLIVYLINRKRDFIPDITLEITYCFWLLFIPLGNLIYANKALKYTPQKETKLNNDFNIVILEIVASSYSIIHLIFIAIVSFFIGDSTKYILIWANCCGRMLVDHIFSYIAWVFLIQNAVLIKKEWNIDTPDFIQKEKGIKPIENNKPNQHSK